MNFKEASKQVWTSNNSTEHINAGSLQRIADACELMAKNYTSMQNDLKWAKDRNQRLERELLTMTRSNRSLRGYIKRLKGAGK